MKRYAGRVLEGFARFASSSARLSPSASTQRWITGSDGTAWVGGSASGRAPLRVRGFARRAHETHGPTDSTRAPPSAGATRRESAPPIASPREAEREARMIMKRLLSLRGAQRAAFFDSIVEQKKANIFHCNAMLGSCATPQDARRFLERMHRLGVVPDVVSYTTMMQVEIRCSGIGAAEALLREMMSLDPPIMPNVRTHLVLIEGHGKRGRLEDAVAAWQRMLKQGIAANEYVYTALIDACAKRMDIERADGIMEAALGDAGTKPNAHMFTSMIDMYARSGQHARVKAIWQQMRTAGVKPDTAAVNAVITALDKAASLDEAKELFAEMLLQDAVQLDCVSYSAMIDAYAKRGLVAQATQLVEEMGARGIAADSALLAALVDLYGKTGALDKAAHALESLLHHAARLIQDAAVHTESPLQDRESRGALARIESTRRNVLRAFNSLLDANLRFGHSEDARWLRRQHKDAADAGISAAADVFTYTILVGNLEPGPSASGQARDLYDEMLAGGVAPDAAFFFSALDVIVKSGDFVSAADVFGLARAEMAPPFAHCLSLSGASAKLDLHGLPRAGAAAALEWVLRLDPRRLMAEHQERAEHAPPGPCDLVVVTGRDMTYVGEPNLIRELVTKALTIKGVRFWAADSANRRARFPKGAGRLVVAFDDWLRHREELLLATHGGPRSLDYFEHEFR